MTTNNRTRRNPLALRTTAPVALASERVTERLYPEEIRTDGGTQMRAGLNEETVVEYIEAITGPNEWPFPPVVVYHDGSIYWLGDGFHRVEAARRYGERERVHLAIPVEIRPGTRRDAVLCAAGANATHGLRRANIDKRRAVETLLRDEEWGQWSDREIARRCRVTHPFVAKIRAEVTGNDYQSQRNLTGNDYHSESALTGNGFQSAPEERIYMTRHGTVATMNVDGQKQAGERRRTKTEQMLTGVGETEQERGASDQKVNVTADVERSSGGSQEPSNAIRNRHTRIDELLTLYRTVVSSLGEYGALTGRHTQTPAVRRALEPLIEELKQNRAGSENHSG